MDDFGGIDYRRPPGEEDDMRTSSYRGHRHITDTMRGNELSVKEGEPRWLYKDDTMVVKARKSDYRTNFVWQYVSPPDQCNPSLRQNALGMKPFFESKLRFVARPLRPAKSVSHETYRWRPESSKPLPTLAFIPRAVVSTKLSINRSQPGYAKLLDPAATTTNLAFVARTPHELMSGVAAHDNITFWNWERKRLPPTSVWRVPDGTTCDNNVSIECPKRREFQCQLKRVPNTGNTTEFRQNYIEPLKREADLDLSGIRNRQTYVPIVPFAKKTENCLYGSGQPTRTYV